MDKEILTKGPQPDDMEEWKSEYVLVNGNLLTIKDYYKNPEKHNKAHFPKSYVTKLPLQLALQIPFHNIDE